MNETEYKDYEARIARFFESEDIDCLNAGEEDRDEFSAASCDCCGTHLAGERYAAKAYSPIDSEIHEYCICRDCLYYAEYGQLDDQTMLDMEDRKLS